MTDESKEQLEIEEIHANIKKLGIETAKINYDLKYDWIKILAYVIATFTAAWFLVLKIQGGT